MSIFRRAAKPVDLPSRATTPDITPPAYAGTDLGEDWFSDRALDDAEFIVAYGSPYVDTEPGLSVTVVDGGLFVGEFTYANKEEFADAIRAHGDFYGDSGTVTLVITAL